MKKNERDRAVWPEKATLFDPLLADLEWFKTVAVGVEPVHYVPLADLQEACDRMAALESAGIVD